MAVVATIEAAELLAASYAPRYELVLPFPPSVNRIWKFVGASRRGRGNVIRDPAYEAWLKHCDGCVLEQIGVAAYRQTIKRRYVLTVTLDSSRYGLVDQDNCVKALSDFIQRARIVANDKWAWRTVIEWGKIDHPHQFEPACHVAVEGI